MVLAEIFSAIGISHQDKQALLRPTQVTDDTVDDLRCLCAEISRSVVEEMESFGDGWISCARLRILVAKLENFVDERLGNAIVPNPLQETRALYQFFRVNTRVTLRFRLVLKFSVSYKLDRSFTFACIDSCFANFGQLECLSLKWARSGLNQVANFCGFRSEHILLRIRFGVTEQWRFTLHLARGLFDARGRLVNFLGEFFALEFASGFLLLSNGALHTGKRGRLALA